MKTPKKFFIPVGSVELAVGLVVGTIVGAGTLIYYIFFKNKK